MKQTSILLIVLMSSQLFARNFALIPSDSTDSLDWGVISGISTAINCEKFLTSFDTTNSTNPRHCTEYDNDDNCLNWVDITSAEINNSTGNCPKLAVDGMLYTISSDVNIYQRNRLMTITSVSLANCVNQDGNPPTIGFQFILSAGQTTTGVENISFNYETWVLHMDSIDGNLTCDGSIGIADDEIFKNSFEEPN